jgi:outer membrane lipoprotein-sorting protein
MCPLLLLIGLIPGSLELSKFEAFYRSAISLRAYFLERYSEKGQVVRPSFSLALALFVSLFAPRVWEIFEARYRAAAALQATFLERYLENGKLIRSDAGVAYFRRPGRMRWEYESPEKNLFLVDGKWAWFYVPADHTVTRVPARQSSDWRTPIALLADNPKLSSVCAKIAPSTTVLPQTSADTVLFCLMRGAKVPDKNQRGADGRENSASTSNSTNSNEQRGPSVPSQSLESRAAAQGDAVFLEIDPQTGILARVLVTQPGAVSIEFRFTNWQFNPPLPESLFHFAVPPNTAIVNGELPDHENSANP